MSDVLLGKSGAGGVGSDVMEFPPFMCRYCPESSWTEDVMRSHLVTVHSDKPAQFGVVQQCSTAMPTFGPLNGRDVTVDDEADDDDDDDDEDEDAAVKYAGGVETGLYHLPLCVSASLCLCPSVFLSVNSSSMWLNFRKVYRKVGFITGPPTHSVGGQTSDAHWRLSSSSVVVCNTPGQRNSPGGKHATAGQ